MNVSKINVKLFLNNGIRNNIIIRREKNVKNYNYKEIAKTRVFDHSNTRFATTCLVSWLARLTVIQEVPGSIPGYTLEIFLEV